MKKFFAVFILVFVASILVSGCGSSEEKKNTGSAVKNELEGAPDWVMGNENTSKQICGVGSAAGTRNASLARTAAMGRGRTEIARTLQVQVKSMLKDYQSTTTGGEAFGQAANDEQHIEDVSKQITDTTLTGSELRKTWISNPGTLYVLMCIDLQKFKDALSNMTQLNEQVRAAVVERADKAFEALDKETAK
ncbi:MAG TPA: LPP20 family lipoprotein [bacterium]|nr:LPP20 family lipoprotein [bacterium]HPS31045.1 LPP20 family lipoprotein [bacterium]